MLDQFSRTELILGRKSTEKLQQSRVAVFGIGGVGGYAVEALARSGIGAIDLIDDDRICLTNLNRQIIATHKTVGQYKVDAAEARISDINPQAVVTKHRCFFTPDTADNFDFSQYDYVIDAIDTVTGKIEIALRAWQAGTPAISAMGAGNKLDASALRVADIYETSICPLARVMRRELKRRGVKGLKVVYSPEPPTRPQDDAELSCRAHCICPPGTARKCTVRRDIPGSVAFVPSVMGLIIAGEVVRDLTGHTSQK
ncbi:MAG TPA: tRNA threonylcarbamoyladenosine dehydratase [Terriglobales bacterium]|nr:tRNA threonylcarbamoyladenosine dehydratase [Terriglobales bacterium]